MRLSCSMVGLLGGFGKNKRLKLELQYCGEREKATVQRTMLDSLVLFSLQFCCWGVKSCW